MESQKIIIDNTPSQLSKFRTKNRFEVNDRSRRTYDKVNQIRFKTSMLRSSLCDCINAYILVKGTATVINIAAEDATANNFNENTILENCAPFIKCISSINNLQVDDAHDIDAVMPMYNFVECIGNYSKPSAILWQYCRDERAVNVANGDFVGFNAANAFTNLFKFKEKVTSKTGINGKKDVEINVPLKKYLSNFCRNLEIPLINCEINLDLIWSKEWVIMPTAVANQGGTFSVTDI